jgi:Mrp family chromosome partitioning ATPase
MSESCGGCPSQDSCTDQGACSPEDEKLARNLGRIKHKIVVLSGKGGVGKSTVAVNIAVALAQAGKQVGLLDVDVHGPSVPRLLSLSDAKPHMEKDGMEPVSWNSNLWVMSLGFLLPDPNQAVIWRGPVKMGLIRQFVQDVRWGDLDYLVVDCPPGTGDEPLSALQVLGPDAHAVVVTTPQGVAVDDVRRSVSFVREVGNPVVGIVENMSGYVFSTGGGERLAREMVTPFLGRIPLDPELVRAGDEGYAFMKVQRDSPTAKAIQEVIRPLLAMDAAGQAAGD